MKHKTGLIIVVVIAALSVTAWGDHHDLRDIVEQVEAGKNAPVEIPVEPQPRATPLKQAPKSIEDFKKIMQSYKLATETGKPETVTPEQLEERIQRLTGEHYKKDSGTLTGALYAMIGLVVTVVLGVGAFMTFLLFRDRKEYQEAVINANKAAERTEKICERTEKLEEKAQAVLAKIDTDVKEKLDDIQAMGHEQIADLIKRADEQRKISDLWSKALTADEQKDYTTAAKLYKELAEDYKNETAPVYFNWGVTINYIANLEQDAGIKRQLLKNACSKYDKAMETKSDMHEAFYNCGLAMTNLAELEQDTAEKRRLLEEVCYKYDKATKINPDLHEAYYNWGNTLKRLVDLESDNGKKRQLFKDMCCKYDKAIQIKPDMHEAYINWGNDLLGLANLEQDDDKKQQLFNDACGKYDKAIKIKPEKYHAYNNWGNALGSLAEIEQDAGKKQQLLKDACYKFGKAVEIKPEKHHAYNRWGNTLELLADLESDENEKQRLIDEAKEKLEKAEEIKKRLDEAGE